MAVSETGAQARDVTKTRQVAVRGSAMLLTAAWLLAGCSADSSINPINWWHRQEGGVIARQRPVPPGADQPYPNLSTIPAKPTAPDPEALKKLTDSLVADRTNAQHAAQAEPLADPSSPSASPALFGANTAPPPPPAASAAASSAPASSSGAAAGPPVASASMPAVNAPPPPPTPAAPTAPPVQATAPTPAPRKAVQSTPLAAPPQAAAANTAAANTEAASTQPASAASAGARTDAAPADTAPAVAAASVPPPSASAAANPAQPALPAAPPARPLAAGPAPAPPVQPSPMPPASSAPSATIVFVGNASSLSSPASDEVKAFAAKRTKGTIVVTGYGDAAANDPETQSSALTLGLSRAQSIVDALKADGVPGNAIRVTAEASGRGAAMQLLQ